MSEDIFSVRVGGTSELDCRCSMRNVACRVSIVSSQGCLLTKSTPNRKVISTNETEEYKYISPVITKTIDSRHLSVPVFAWNETFMFNELFSYICQAKAWFFFEVIDYTLYEGRKNFCPLAWGYLKLQDLEGKIVNTNVQRNIQLFEYPHNFELFPCRVSLPTFKLLDQKKPISTIMSVCVSKTPQIDDTIVLFRSFSPFQAETGKDVNRLIEEEEDSISLDQDESEDLLEALSSSCLIPKHLKTQIYPGDHGALCLRFNHQGTVLAAGIQKDRNFHIDLFNTTTMKLIESIPAHLDTIYDLQFSNDDKQMLSVSGDSTAKVWNVEAPHKPMVLPHLKFLYAAKFHPSDNNYVFTAGFDGVIRVWDLNLKQNTKELRGHNTRINTIVFSPNGHRMYAGDANGTISVWRTVIDKDGLNLASKKILHDDEIGNVGIVHLDMVRSNLSLLVQTHDDMIRVFDTKAMTTTQRYVGAKCKRYLMRSSFSPDGAYVISGSEDGNVLLWTVRMAKSEHVLQWANKFTKPVTSLAWNPKMNMVAFSSFGAQQPILIFIDPYESKFDMSQLNETSLPSSSESD